jgi:hypothetical protein
LEQGTNACKRQRWHQWNGCYRNMSLIPQVTVELCRATSGRNLMSIREDKSLATDRLVNQILDEASELRSWSLGRVICLVFLTCHNIFRNRGNWKHRRCLQSAAAFNGEPKADCLLNENVNMNRTEIGLPYKAVAISPLVIWSLRLRSILNVISTAETECSTINDRTITHGMSWLMLCCCFEIFFLDNLWE